MNKKKVIIVTFIMIVLNIFGKHLYDLGLFSGGLTLIYTPIIGCLTAFVYVKIKNVMCGENLDLVKKLHKIIIYEWLIIEVLECIVFVIIRGIGECVYILWAITLDSIHSIVVIFIFIKLIELMQRKYEKININNECKNVENEVNEIEVIMRTVISILIITFICWFFERRLYGELFPVSENIIVMLPVVIIGLATEFLPLICAVLYVIYENKLNSRVALLSWIIFNALLGGGCAIYDGIKGYRYGNFVIEIVNMGYFRTIIRTIVLVLGTIILVKLIKKSAIKNEK